MNRTPEEVGVFIGLLVLFITRLLDFFLPKGSHFKWFERYGRIDEPDDPAEEEGE